MFFKKVKNVSRSVDVVLVKIELIVRSGQISVVKNLYTISIANLTEVFN